MKKKILAVILGLQIIMLSGCVGAAGISKDEFERLDTGMSLSEAEEIIGGKGTLISDSETKADSHNIHTKIYEYSGELGGSATLTFVHDVDIYDVDFSSEYELTSKSQKDLK